MKGSAAGEAGGRNVTDRRHSGKREKKQFYVRKNDISSLCHPLDNPPKIAYTLLITGNEGEE